MRFPSSSIIVFLLSSAAMTAYAVDCAPTDKAGGSLKSTGVDGGMVTCTYTEAGECEYFPGNGESISGSSSCPDGIAQPAPGSSSTSSTSTTTTSSSTTLVVTNTPVLTSTSSSSSNTVLTTAVVTQPGNSLTTSSGFTTSTTPLSLPPTSSSVSASPTGQGNGAASLMNSVSCWNVMALLAIAGVIAGGNVV